MHHLSLGICFERGNMYSSSRLLLLDHFRRSADVPLWSSAPVGGRYAHEVRIRYFLGVRSMNDWKSIY